MKSISALMSSYAPQLLIMSITFGPHFEVQKVERGDGSLAIEMISGLSEFIYIRIVLTAASHSGSKSLAVRTLAMQGLD